MSQIQKSEAACVIPFKSDISADEVRSEATLKTIESEFVSKYLEKIGVTPTKGTAELMRKLTPINLSTLDTQLKPGKGSETEVCITLKPPKQNNGNGNAQNTAKNFLNSTTLVENPTSSESLISLGILAQLPEEFSRELERKRLAKEKADVSTFEDPSSEGDDELRRGANLFTQASTQHLFPYNLKKKNAKSKFQGGIFHHNHPSSKQQKAHSQDATAQQPEEVTEHLVQIFQEDFIKGLEDWKAQNSVSLKGSIYLKDRAFSSVQNTLLSRPVLKLFKVTAIYLKEKFINTRGGRGQAGGAQDVPESRKVTEQAERLYFILNEFSRLSKANRKEKIGLCFVLPILLLSLRTFVEHVTKLLFPTLSTTPEGKDITAKMDNTITTLLDPHSWYSRVSVFQSTRTAMHIMNSYRQSAHQPIRYTYHHTSAHVRAALGNPLSSQYRSFIHNSQKQDYVAGRNLKEVQAHQTDGLGVGHRKRLLL
ncbi:hypothetical protein HOP50_04g29860 [Chloropicon primus]|uniref:Uncharacterized protein n=1 Tax=Chloropicon primus TaxID=1764295 RepID=A0A5B8MJ84_9CHLO|nr:hypothetical protein A3770_04p29870 [Chloropicon primus]UPQ99678.1 hypothetical protein HOP50_04g29860 [Chloropicon primus]|eukprot:QDZ20469.1 hypothetical protein A3770_04p29870 [Chloropicon primus]